MSIFDTHEGWHACSRQGGAGAGSHRNGASRSPEEDEEEEEAFLRWAAAAEEVEEEYQLPPDEGLRAELGAKVDARVEPGVLRVRALAACMHASCMPSALLLHYMSRAGVCWRLVLDVAGYDGITNQE